MWRFLRAVHPYLPLPTNQKRKGAECLPQRSINVHLAPSLDSVPGNRIDEQIHASLFSLSFPTQRPPFPSEEVSHFLEEPEVTFPYPSRSSTVRITEYEPCVTGLQAAVYMGIEELDVFGDSSLVISQTIGKWEIQDAKFLPYHGYFEALAKKFKRITFAYMSRTKKNFVDAKATLASMIEIPEETQELETSGETNQSTVEHIGQFTVQCGEAGANDFLKMRLFANSLSDTAFEWYINLPSNLIQTWQQMETLRSSTKISPLASHFGTSLACFDFLKRLIRASLTESLSIPLSFRLSDPIAFGYLSCGFGVSRFNKSFPSDLRIKSSALRCLTQPFQFIALQSKALWPRCTLYSQCQNSRKKANVYETFDALYQCCVWAQSAGEANRKRMLSKRISSNCSKI
ncbi:hypothetical protein NE237_022890 [Protea cynaroides]|uniref:RNase H type-1 domain-containing protein n=1 Tax=Protea cynaroides TaxID=273540 RepID=A0A9Q0HCU3_9MAGN|nr:hypothetical protein NE237_022890 [Protea cynaroides]